MTNAIIGTGIVGTTLAHLFSQAGVEAHIANTRGAETIHLDEGKSASVTPVSLSSALSADLIFAAVPFAAMPTLGRALPDWSGRIIIDVTNPFGVEPATFGSRSSSEFNADFFPGGILVKAINHLPYNIFDAEIAGSGGRRAVFVSSDDEAAGAAVAELAKTLGFAPINLGPLAVGAPLLSIGGPLLMKNLVEYPF